LTKDIISATIKLKYALRTVIWLGTEKKKEMLTMAGITEDLRKVAWFKLSRLEDWRMSYIIPIAGLALFVGIYFKKIVIALLIFSIAAYHIVKYIREAIEYVTQKKALAALVDRGDISISIEKFSHIADETIYEPHTTGRGHTNNYRDVKMFYFESGVSWRMQSYWHYEWSKEYYLSAEGLINTSVGGNEFFYITLKGEHDISYIYPCKLFELDEKLKSLS
jgi:hypothetical protein